MSPNQIESWALRVINAVRDGHRVEDTRVELKSVFPEDPTKAARRIAAHANSAHGAPILWIIGVNEDGSVPGAHRQDLATWWPAIVGQFDGVHPSLTDVVLYAHGAELIALKFDTDRAPFVVNNPAGGAIQREVPWREGTRTRTATRDELVSILQPDIPIPEFEVLDAALEGAGKENNRDVVAWSATVYTVPRSRDALVFPFHRCSGRILNAGVVVCGDMEFGCSIDSGRRQHGTTWFRASSNPVVNVYERDLAEVVDNQAVFGRPARMNVKLCGVLTVPLAELAQPTVELVLGMAPSGRRHTLSVQHPHMSVGARNTNVWSHGPPTTA